MFMICSGGSWWYRFCRRPQNTDYPLRHTIGRNIIRQPNYGERNTVDELRNHTIIFPRMWRQDINPSIVQQQQQQPPHNIQTIMRCMLDGGYTTR